MSADADPFDGGKIPTVFSDAKTLSREIITVFCYGNELKKSSCLLQNATCYCLAKYIQTITQGILSQQTGLPIYKPRSAVLKWYCYPQLKAGGKRRREMGAWTRELLQAE